MPPIKFPAQSDTVWEEISFEEFLNLHVATMSPTKFQLNPTYESGGDVENVKS